MHARGGELPRELAQITARIDRLRERLRHGDPDLAPDELAAAIEKAEAKRRELIEAGGDWGPAEVIALLPKAAELFREQITLGLDGDPQAALKARTILRALFCGEIRLIPEPDGGLVAQWMLDAGALVRATVTSGSGGVLWSNQN